MPTPKKNVKGTGWNQAMWNSARKRAIASMEPYCAICGSYLDKDAPANTPLAIEVDHITPLARGGQPYELENLQLTCHRCNRSKGSRMDTDYKGAKPENPCPISNPW